MMGLVIVRFVVSWIVFVVFLIHFHMLVLFVVAHFVFFFVMVSESRERSGEDKNCKNRFHGKTPSLVA
jgi:hypothetical protein